MECDCTVTLPGPSLATCGGSTLSVFMLVLEQFLRTQCDIENPCGQITPCNDPLPEYDFIVVGGGSAGSVVASRLSEIPEWRVLLIEAGVNEPTASQVPSLWNNAQNTSVDWHYVTEPMSTAFLNNGGRAIWPRGKTDLIGITQETGQRIRDLNGESQRGFMIAQTTTKTVIGGSSVLNSMVYIRGNRQDYNHWEEMGNPGWSYKNVLPYFIKSENNLQIDLVDRGYHGVGGNMPVSRYPFIFPFEADLIRGAQETGQRIRDLNGESQRGFMIAQTTTKNGIRFSSSHSFLRPMKYRKNLYILLNTIVTKVLINFTTKKAFGVEFIRGNGRKEVILSAKEVIVCGGAIGSPKILLQSGLGYEKELNRIGIPVVHNLPGVGRNLHDHVTYKVKFTTNQSDINDLNRAVARTYLKYRDGAMSTTGDSIVGFMQTKYANPLENYPDIRFQFGGYQARCSQTGRNCEINGDLINGKIPTRQVTMRSILVQPRSRGYLTLRNKDPLSYPKLFPRYLSNPADIPPMIEGIKYLLRLSKTDVLKKYGIELDRTPEKGCESFSFGSDRYWECAIRRETNPDNHQAGSCKMGPDSDPEAVVDPQLRVRGVRGLRVVDASIMPKVVAGNIHGPTVMIAEKASDFIKHYWFSNHPYGF